MAVDIGGNTSLKWEAGIETDKLKKDGRESEKILLGIYDKPLKIGRTFTEQLKENIRLMAQLNGAKGSNSSVDVSSSPNNSNAFKQAQIEVQKALKESRLEMERLKREQKSLQAQTDKLRNSQQKAREEIAKLLVIQQDLRNKYQEGRVTLQEYQKKLAENRVEQKGLNNTLAQGRIDAQNYKTELAKLNLEQRKQAIAIKESRAAMTAANGSYAEAQRRLRELGKEIRNAEGGFANMGKAQRARIKEYAQLNGALQKFDFQMKNHQRNVGNYGSGIGALNSGINGLVGSFASLYSAVATVGRSMTVNSEVADSLSDVQRTAGLTADEASRLAENLKKIDTRTSLKGLIDISVIGGQLGIAKDQLVGFTRAIDQLGVVLAGEITGGAEAVATALGKINGVFKVQQQEGTDTEKALNKTGSAILALGQAGLATGEFLQDFGLRVAGVAQSANISLPTILAYAAVLEETGSSAEVSGTAFNRLVGSLAGNRKEFFRIAQIADASLTLEKFTDVINTDANKALQMFFAGLNKGGTNLTSFNDLIAKIGVKAGPSKNAIVALAQNQELLNTRIAQGTDAYKDGTLAADQFEIKNNNLAGSLAKLGNEFDKLLQGDGIGNRVFKPIIDGLTGTLTYFDKLVSSDSWKEFFVRIDPKTSNVKKFGELAAMADKVGRDNSDDPTARIEYELAQFKEQDDKKRLSRLKAEKGELDKIMALYKEQLKRDREVQAQFKLKRGDSDQTKDLRRQVQNQAKVFGALYEAQFKKTPIKIEPKKVDAPATLGDSKEANKKEISSRQALQKRIDELINSSKRKQLTNDEEEIQSVRDKYAAMWVEVNNFYKNNANKGLKVDTSGLTKAENLEIETAKAKQQLERTKQTIDEQKAIFSQFEDYKLEYGQAKAEERFKGEKKEYQTYVDYLKSLQPAESDKSVAANLTRDFLSKELPKAVKEANDKAYDNELKNLKRILEATKTAKNEELRINEQYDKDLATLRKSYSGEDLEEREKALAEQRQLELEGVKRLAFESSEIGKALATDLFYKTRKELKAQLDKLKELLKDEGLAPEQKKALESSAGNVEELIESSNDFARIANIIANKANEIASALTGLGDAIGGSIGYTISQIGELAGIAGDAAGAAASFASGDIIGGITKGIKAVTGLISMGKKVKEMNKAARAEVTKFYEDAIKGEMEYQALLRSRERDNVARGKTTYNGIIAQLELLKKQSPEIQAQYDKIYASLQGEEYIEGQGYKHGTWLRKAKTWDIMASLNGVEYSKLEKLYTEGKLKDAALADFEQLKKFREELEEAGLDIEELQKQLNELLTGTSVEGLSNALSDLFENGKLSAQDFGDSFESILKKAIVNGFKYKYIEKEAEALFAQLSAASEDGSITKQEADDFRKASLEAGERLTERWKLITEGLGVDFANANNSSGLTGGIAASLTESTGSALEGLWRGQYDITKKQYAITVQMNTSLYELTQNSVRGLNQLIAINTNTANTVTEVKNAVTELKAINRNTTEGRAGRDPL